MKQKKHRNSDTCTKIMVNFPQHLFSLLTVVYRPATPILHIKNPLKSISIGMSAVLYCQSEVKGFYFSLND